MSDQINMAEHVAKLSMRENMVISFTDNEARRLIHPHTDTLVVTLSVANGKVFLIWIDTGSYADILFASAFLPNECRKRHNEADQDTAIWIWQGEGLCRRAIQLPVTFGQRLVQITQMVDFLLVDQPSAFNAIISRPTLNVLLAVISTYHLAMKFPVEDLVSEVRGDQAESRQCYIMSTRSQRSTRW